MTRLNTAQPTKMLNLTVSSGEVLRMSLVWAYELAGHMVLNGNVEVWNERHPAQRVTYQQARAVLRAYREGVI